jgi:hypothetical protein
MGFTSVRFLTDASHRQGAFQYILEGAGTSGGGPAGGLVSECRAGKLKFWGRDDVTAVMW